MPVSVVNGYCTSAEVRNQLDDVGSALDADLIATAINAASRWIEGYCNRKFWLDAVATTRIYRPEAARTLWTDDIGTTAGLIIKSDTNRDATWATTWDAADYLLGPPNAGSLATGDLATAHAWWQITAIGNRSFLLDQWRSTVQVTARWGWSAVPEEVHMACIIRAIQLFRRKNAPLGVAGFNEFGALRIARTDPDIVALLDRFRLVTL